jgi:hypothetical protein
VKLDPGSKRILDELQARLLLETGRRHRLQDILAAAIRVAARRREELLRELSEEWKPLARSEAEKLLDELSFDADEDASTRVDEALYG